MHQHKSFRLGTEHALCRNRGGRWWIWHKKTFVISRSPTMNLTPKAVERASVATCCTRHSASKSIAKHAYIPRDCPRVTRVHTQGLSPSLLAKTVPVAFLFSTDTTGGNSGSLVLNSKGELVGVNFDRAFKATTNDFAWNQRYSRSIGVDVRYVLWITGEVFGTEHLVQEMLSNNTATIAPGASLDKAPVIYPREVRLLV